MHNQKHTKYSKKNIFVLVLVMLVTYAMPATGPFCMGNHVDTASPLHAFPLVQTASAASAEAAGETVVSGDTQNLRWPKGPSAQSLSADSAIVMELSTGTILYQKNMHVHHYPASITKILTTLLALKHCSLSESLTFTNAEVHSIVYGDSNINSQTGETFTMEQALHAVMLASANEMCVAVADHVAGTKQAFVKMMNEEVASLGLKDTHFMNPNGLHDPNHYTSAYDMACIAREAWKNQTFRKITGSKKYTIKKTNKRTNYQMLNHHQMLNGYELPKYQYKYCIGGKTGYTSHAHATLVTYAEKNGMQLVSVIMKATDGRQSEPNEYSDSTRLLNYGFSHFKKYVVNQENNQVNDILFHTFNRYFDEASSPVQLEDEASVILPKGVKLSQASQTVYYYKNQTIQSGENRIGKVTYTYGAHRVGNTNIMYNNTKTAKYLDRAARKMVSTKISQLHTRKQMFSGIYSFFSNLHFSLVNGVTNIHNFFSKHWVILILIILFILLVILNIIRYLSDTRMERHKKKLRRERERRKERVVRERMEARRHTKHIIQKSGQEKSAPSRDKGNSKKHSHRMQRVAKDNPVREADKGYHPKKRKNRNSMDFTMSTGMTKKPSLGSVSLPDSKKFKNARKHTSESFGHNRFDQGKK